MSEFKLYQLTNAVVGLEEMNFDEETREASMQIIKEQLEEKSEGIIQVLRNMQGQIDMIDTEIKRLSELKKIRQNKVDSFKGYIKLNLEEMGVKKVETSLGVMSVRKNAPSVVIDGEIDEKYYKVKEVKEVDKTKIKEDIKNGIVVDGTRLEAGTSLLIK